MKLGAAIEYCVTFEKLIAGVYASFAVRWPEPPLGLLWRELEAEGKAHSWMLEQAANLPAAERDDPGENQVRKLRAVHDFLMVHHPLEMLSLDEALAFALDLEDLKADYVYRGLLELTTGDWRMSRILRTAITRGGQHAIRIAKAIRGHSRDPNLQARAPVFEERGRVGVKPPRSRSFVPGRTRSSRN